MEPVKMLESESEGSRSVNNLTEIEHNQDMKPLEQSVQDGDRARFGDAFEGVVGATNGGDKPGGGASSDEKTPPLAPVAIAIAATKTIADADKIIPMDLIVIDETEGHQQVNGGVESVEKPPPPPPLATAAVSIAIVADADGDQTLPMDPVVIDEIKGHQQVNEGNENFAMVAIEEDGVDDGKHPNKRVKYNTDGDREPPKEHNFLFRLFGVNIYRYRENTDSKDSAEGSSCTATVPGAANGPAHGGVGCSSNGGPFGMDTTSAGKPPV